MGGTRKGVGAYLSLSLRGREVGWGWVLVNFFYLQDGHLFEVGTNSRLGAYSNKYGRYIFNSSPWIKLNYTSCLSGSIKSWIRKQNIQYLQY